jgi:hypothetical protein
MCPPVSRYSSSTKEGTKLAQEKSKEDLTKQERHSTDSNDPESTLIAITKQVLLNHPIARMPHSTVTNYSRSVKHYSQRKNLLTSEKQDNSKSVTRPVENHM